MHRPCHEGCSYLWALHASQTQAHPGSAQGGKWGTANDWAQSPGGTGCKADEKIKWRKPKKSPKKLRRELENEGEDGKARPVGM